MSEIEFLKAMHIQWSWGYALFWSKTKILGENLSLAFLKSQHKVQYFHNFANKINNQISARNVNTWNIFQKHNLYFDFQNQKHNMISKNSTPNNDT